jgi:hypothetical protein
MGSFRYLIRRKEFFQYQAKTPKTKNTKLFFFTNKDQKKFHPEPKRMLPSNQNMIIKFFMSILKGADC